MKSHEIQTELQEMETRRDQLQAEATTANTELDAAREAVLTGTAPDVQRLTAAQSASAAVEGALAIQAQRIAAKREELAATQQAEARTGHIAQLARVTGSMDTDLQRLRAIGAAMFQALQQHKDEAAGILVNLHDLSTEYAVVLAAVGELTNDEAATCNLEAARIATSQAPLALQLKELPDYPQQFIGPLPLGETIARAIDQTAREKLQEEHAAANAGTTEAWQNFIASQQEADRRAQEQRQQAQRQEAQRQEAQAQPVQRREAQVEPVPVERVQVAA